MTVMEEHAEVFLLDDDRSVRIGVGSLLEAAGYRVDAFERPEDLRAACRGRHDRPILLVDICLADADGFDVLEALRGDGVDPVAIAMSGQANLPMAKQAIRASVVDFLEKPFTRHDLFAALDRATTLQSSVATHRPLTAEEEAAKARFKTLSPRERDVFHGIAAGITTKGIARELGISPRTVEIHRGRVMRKMEAANVADIVKVALFLERER
ncbi:MAG: LuxR C-terminal-related transcriptional regulator [Pseudomonadota bacterium]